MLSVQCPYLDALYTPKKERQTKFIKFDDNVLRVKAIQNAKRHKKKFKSDMWTKQLKKLREKSTEWLKFRITDNKKFYKDIPFYNFLNNRQVLFLTKKQIIDNVYDMNAWLSVLNYKEYKKMEQKFKNIKKHEPLIKRIFNEKFQELKDTRKNMVTKTKKTDILTSCNKKKDCKKAFRKKCCLDTICVHGNTKRCRQKK